MSPQLVIVMPAYNERECIESSVLEWLAVAREIGRARVMVVDDGSTDATTRILDTLAAGHADLVVIHKQNGGHASALLHGYREALASGCEWVFQTDSNRQFGATDFACLWQQRGAWPFVLGWRRRRPEAGARRALRRAHKHLVGWLFGVRVEDCNVPYRLMHAPLLDRYLRQVPRRALAPNVLLAVLAAREGLLAPPIEVEIRARHGALTSSGALGVAPMALRCLREYWRFRRVALKTGPAAR